MGKFYNAAAVARGTPVEQLQEQIPTTEPEAVQEAAPDTDPDLEALLNADFSQEEAAENLTQSQQIREDEAALEAQFAATPEGQAQLEQEAISGPRARYMDARSGQRVNIYESRAANKAKKKTEAQVGMEAGIFARANNMVSQVNNPEPSTLPQTTLPVGVGPKDIQKAQAGEGTTFGALAHKIGAVTGPTNPEFQGFPASKATINPDFLKVGSLVTENFFAGEFDSSKKADETEGFQEFNVFEGAEDAPEVFEAGAASKKANNSARLGRQIQADYNREFGGAPVELSVQEATLLGDTFKEVYQQANPDLINRVQSGSQVEFVLTPKGQEVMQRTGEIRKMLFPKEHVAPLKAPSPTGRQIGEGKTVTKEVSGRKPGQAKSNQKLLDEAVANLGQVGHMVNRQREKILYSLAIPVLKGDQSPATQVAADLLDVGEGKMQIYRKIEETIAKQNEGKPAEQQVQYSADQVMGSLKNKLGQEIFGIASNRKGENFQTWMIQGFAGRVTPQQTHFNLTTGKKVRFVTSAVAPAVARKGNRIQRNLEQMYVLHLVDGNLSGFERNGRKLKGEELLPQHRPEALRNATPKLLAWGRRLRQVMDETMTDSELDAVAEAIAQGIPMDDPSFPPVRGIQLDPEKDADLIKAIRKKGEDGPMFIDGLMDFARYHHAMENGMEHRSFFNATMDGKTNGMAIFGVALGSESLASATGVIRENDIELLDEGDLRDKMASTLLNKLKDGNSGLHFSERDMERMQKSGVEVAELTDIAQALFQFRDLNKKTLMTFGYGMGLAGIKATLSDFIGEVEAAVESMSEQERVDAGLETFLVSLASARAKMDAHPETKGVGPEALLGETYVEGMVEVLDPVVVEAVELMKATGKYAGLNDEVLRLEGPSGLPLIYGGVDEGTLGQVESIQKIKVGDKQIESVVYAKPKMTAAATRSKDFGGFSVEQNVASTAGVPGPIHAMDAATIAKTVTRSSWDKLQRASNNKGYFHPVYDAVKTDANGYDVVLEEVNKNFYNVARNWSFIDEMKKAVDRTNKGILESLDKEIPDNIEMEFDDIAPQWQDLFNIAESADGKVYPTAFKMFSGDFAFEHAKTMVTIMKNQGFDVYNDDYMSGKTFKNIIKAYIKERNLSGELESFSKVVKQRQKELDKKINKKDIYQFFAH